jgi:hypothetical protein
MSRRALCLSGAVLVFLTAPSRGAARQDDEKKAHDAAAQDILRVLTAMHGPNVRETSAALGSKHELYHIHDAFKLRTRGGLGIDCVKAPPGVRDGIEMSIFDLARAGRPVPPGFLGPNKHHLIAVARTTEAIGWMTYAHTPKKKSPGKDPADWVKSNDEMIQASRQLALAADAEDTKAIKEAAVRLNNACIDCHNIWRD